MSSPTSLEATLSDTDKKLLAIKKLNQYISFNLPLIEKMDIYDLESLAMKLQWESNFVNSQISIVRGPDWSKLREEVPATIQKRTSTKTKKQKLVSQLKKLNLSEKQIDALLKQGEK